MRHRLMMVCMAAFLMGLTTDTTVAFMDPSVTPTGALPFDNWDRRTLDTTYQQWRGPNNGGTPSLAGGGENFTSQFGLNSPDDDHFNPNGAATAQYLDETRNSTEIRSIILTAGSRNSYSFEASADWELIVPDYAQGVAATTTLILQLEVSGTEILVGSSTPNNPTAPNTVKVDGYDWVDHVELARSPVIGGGLFDTFDVTHWFRFELPLNTAEHLIEFDTYHPSLGEFDDMLWGHTSIVALAVDTIARPAGIPGDLDGDGIVDLADLALVLNNWDAQEPPPFNEAQAAADADDDGIVGLTDLALVLNNWNRQASSGNTAVPEPGALTMLGVGGVFLLRRGR